MVARTTVFSTKRRQQHDETEFFPVGDPCGDHHGLGMDFDKNVPASAISWYDGNFSTANEYQQQSRWIQC